MKFHYHAICSRYSIDILLQYNRKLQRFYPDPMKISDYKTVWKNCKFGSAKQVLSNKLERHCMVLRSNTIFSIGGNWCDLIIPIRCQDLSCFFAKGFVDLLLIKCQSYDVYTYIYFSINYIPSTFCVRSTGIVIAERAIHTCNVHYMYFMCILICIHVCFSDHLSSFPSFSSLFFMGSSSVLCLVPTPYSSRFQLPYSYSVVVIWLSFSFTALSLFSFVIWYVPWYLLIVNVCSILQLYVHVYIIYMMLCCNKTLRLYAVFNTLIRPHFVAKSHLANRVWWYHFFGSQINYMQV